MPIPHYRYFIELQPRDGAPVPRFMEAETRRAEAGGFVETMRRWLDDRKLGGKVSSLGITAFGQIQITCEAEIIKLLGTEDVIDIAAIREGAIYMENASRWNELRQDRPLLRGA